MGLPGAIGRDIKAINGQLRVIFLFLAGNRWLRAQKEPERTLQVLSNVGGLPKDEPGGFTVSFLGWGRHVSVSC